MVNRYSLTDKVDLVPVELPKTYSERLTGMFGRKLVIHDKDCGMIEGTVSQIKADGDYQLNVHNPSQKRTNSTRFNLNLSTLLGVYERQLKASS